MGNLSFSGSSLLVTLLAFAVAAFFVWEAGTRLSRYLDGISRKTGIGGGFIGFVVLAGITSLPEAATVTTASIAGDAPLAVNNLLGSAAINVVLLAVADAFLGRRALTSVLGSPTPMLQGVLSILVMAVVAVAVLAGDVDVGGVGLWSVALLVLFLFAGWLTSKYEERPQWRAVSGGMGESGKSGAKPTVQSGSLPLRWLLAKAAIAALVILAAGFVLARSGSAIADKTGVSSGLVGLVLVAFATSLPEISTIRSAMQLRRYEMVMGDIFGTNIFNFTLIILADVFYAGPPVLGASGPFEAVATLVALILTGIYLVGLLERRDQTVWRMGYSSLAVLIVYAIGLSILYTMARNIGAA